MKQNLSDNLKLFAASVIIIMAMGRLAPSPWWLFTLPLAVLGLAAAALRWKVKAFTTGFAAGFAVWMLVNLFIDTAGSGIILGKLGAMTGVGKPVVLLAAGVAGGLTAGLALYTGYQMLRRADTAAAANALHQRKPAN